MFIKNTIVWILAYLQQTPIWKLLIHGFFIICIAFGISFSYILANNFTYVFENVLDLNTPKQLHDEIVMSIEVAKTVDIELRELLKETSSARAYVFKFHNGTSSFGNVPFLYQTNTNEIVAAGISSEINNLQKIPITINLEKMQAYVDNVCYYYKTQKINMSSFDYLLYNQGIEYIYTCPIYNQIGYLIGFMGIDYNVNAYKRPLNTTNYKLNNFIKSHIE